MNREMLAGLVRHAGTVVGGMMVSHGYIRNTELESIIGLLVSLAGVWWSLHAKQDPVKKQIRRRRRAAKKNIVVPSPKNEGML